MHVLIHFHTVFAGKYAVKALLNARPRRLQGRAQAVAIGKTAGQRQFRPVLFIVRQAVRLLFLLKLQGIFYRAQQKIICARRLHPVFLPKIQLAQTVKHMQ